MVRRSEGTVWGLPTGLERGKRGGGGGGKNWGGASCKDREVIKPYVVTDRVAEH